jgi:SAM-dependent methyltransferase
MSDAGPNRDQAEYWNAEPGSNWTKRQGELDAQLGPIGRVAMEALEIIAGEHLLDVGCGCGHTTLELAKTVGPTGSATGADLSREMLACARDRARESGLPNVTFVEADAQTEVLGPGRFDGVYSRFGVMFFDDPEAAFRNLLNALRPGGRLGFVCWQPLLENPWMMVPLAAAAQHVQLPPPPPPGTPGPFAFGDPDRVRGILEGAGFEKVRIDPWRGELAPGGGRLSTGVDLFLEIGPVSRVLREAGAGPEVKKRVVEAIREAIVPFEGPDGVRMPCATWIVTARR